MLINGREVLFKRTVKANCDIADMCKDQNINNIESLFEGSYQASQRTSAKFMAVLSEGYELSRVYQDPGYKPHPLTVDEAMNMGDEEFTEAFKEAIQAYAGEKPTVETQPAKGKKKAEKPSN